MIKVHYDHPPRAWDFYVGIALSFILNIGLCVTILTLTWGDIFAVQTHIFLVINCTIWTVFLRGRQILHFYISQYDKKLTKTQDVTHLNLSPSKDVLDGIQIAKELGFQRLRELQLSSASFTKTILLWFLLDSSQDTCLLILPQGQSYAGSFFTWFDNSQLLATVYPSAFIGRKQGIHIEAISTSLESAYRYHLHQIAKYEASFGAPIKITSRQALDELSIISQQTQGKHRKIEFQVRTATINFLHGLSIASVIYTVCAVIVFSKNGFLYISSLQLGIAAVLTAAYCLLSFVFIRFLAAKGHDISQVKKKEA
jgi:hypothetical protein